MVFLARKMGWELVRRKGGGLEESGTKGVDKKTSTEEMQITDAQSISRHIKSRRTGR